MRRLDALGAAALLALSGLALAGAELSAFAVLPADTFAAGPGAGAGISANGRTGPFPGQPVQGLSAVQRAAGSGEAFWFLSDNGFGQKGNSGDYLLRIYRLRPSFRTAAGGDGEVAVEGFIQLSDPDRHVPCPIALGADQQRPLTGADFDPESFVIDPNGEVWIGDELGPFVLRFDAQGRLLDAPIATPDVDMERRLDPIASVRSPDHPDLTAASDANLARSGGFEAMALAPNGHTLYAMLEKSVAGDPIDALRIYAFDLATAGFSHLVGLYRKAAPDHAIGDLAPVNKRELLIIERDQGQGASAKFKKIFKIDIHAIDRRGYVAKEEVVDLLSIRDPNDLDQDGNTRFRFPFVTIESLLVVSGDTILVANDNNYPFSVGRGPDIDRTEIILLKLDQPLHRWP